MSDKSVVFYAIETDFISVACKLIEKLYEQNERVLFLCDNEDEIDFYNSKLWTFSKLSFIPSGNDRSIHSKNAEFCHTWFSTKLVYDNNPSCLLHNGISITQTDNLKNFARVIDIFGAQNIDAAQSRSEIYKESSFLNQKIWIQNGSTWEAGKLW